MSGYEHWEPCGSTSDCLDFSTSSLRSKVEKPGFLALGLVLHDDNAYISNEFVVMPIKNVSSGSKDACDFYQQQVRIRVKCSFGMLVHRWAILRKPIPPFHFRKNNIFDIFPL